MASRSNSGSYDGCVRSNPSACLSRELSSWSKWGEFFMENHDEVSHILRTLPIGRNGRVSWRAGKDKRRVRLRTNVVANLSFFGSWQAILPPTPALSNQNQSPFPTISLFSPPFPSSRRRRVHGCRLHMGYFIFRFVQSTHSHPFSHHSNFAICFISAQGRKLRKSINLFPGIAVQFRFGGAKQGPHRVA